MGSAQPLPLTPALTLINRQTSTRFRHINNLHCFTPKTWSRNADTSFDCRFPFLSYSISPPLHPSFPLCSRFPLPRPPLPSLFPLGFHPLRSFLMSSMTTPQAAASDSRSLPKLKRNWTIENATQLGLKGWVRNRRDGSVEALFSGTPDSVEKMEQRCRRGPPAAMVTGLQVFPSNDDPGTGFQRKQTV
ncbi:hypothetical protein ES332_D04G137800v1 [Gossypium tomentosum]|uniref:acylphosphatase n=1 Tax=Gossypium tomentosum TaxID=34277 RepID=A0A5D2LD13_GOSTO|nr:hypothetical protein ES332_D04G137800v1 [Gossypium tomentosum]